MEKLYSSITFLKMAGGRMHTTHPTPLDPPLAINYGNHQKSLVYFSHSAPLLLFFSTRRHSQKKEAMTQCCPKYAPASADVVFFIDIQRRAAEMRKKSSLA